MSQLIPTQDYVYPASEATALTRQLIHYRHNGAVPGSSFGTGKVDDKMIPMQPGDLVLVCGRPANGKSLVMRHMLYKATQKVMEIDPTGNRATVLITWEESIEQAMATWLAVTSGISATDMLMGKLTIKQLDSLDTTIVQVGAWSLYIVGISTQRANDGKRRRRALNTEAATAAIDHLINDRGLELDLIVGDYLQRIPNSRGLDSNTHYTQCVDWAKDTAMQVGCPFVLGTQARREVDGYKLPLPTLSDSQWSSNAEQSADKYFSVWMPKQTHALGERLELGSLPALTVTDNLLILALMKNKYGSAPHIFPMYVEPEYLRVGDMDTFTEGVEF